MDITKLIRPALREMAGYSSARDEFSGRAKAWLDANENPFGGSFRGVTALNRYPDPRQDELREKIAAQYGLSKDNVFCGNGSDEILDLLVRATCKQGDSEVITCPPTYGMYGVLAQINETVVNEVPYDTEFNLRTDAIHKAAGDRTRIIFICSPNNPTGRLAPPEDIRRLATGFNGLVVVDEAYIEFSGTPGALPLLKEQNNIVILRTFSKARGLAGIRLGVAFADSRLVRLLDTIKLPYNISRLTIEAALQSLEREKQVQKQVEMIVGERVRLHDTLEQLKGIEKVYRSDANFLLVKCDRPKELYTYLTGRAVIVRDRSSMPLCEGCLRITVGRPRENDLVTELINRFYSGGDKETTRESKRVSVRRRSLETDVFVDIDLRGNGLADVQSGSGFLDHMLELLAFHGSTDLVIRASGDLQVDLHHTVEDIAITLGQALSKALGDRKGIARYGFTLPMDESRAGVTIDLGGRSFLSWKVKLSEGITGDIPADMFEHFFRSFASAAGCTLHIEAEGTNDHHITEAVFKAFARAMANAVAEAGNDLPSTKGLI